MSLPLPNLDDLIDTDAPVIAPNVSDLVDTEAPMIAPNIADLVDTEPPPSTLPKAEPIEQPKPDTLKDDFTGIAANARLAWNQLGTNLDTLALDSIASRQAAPSKARTELEEFDRQWKEAMAADPGGRLEQIRNQLVSKVAAAEAEAQRSAEMATDPAKRLAEREGKAKELQVQLSPEMKAWNEAEGMDAVKVFASNPFEVISNIIATGAVSSTPSIVAGSVAGPFGVAQGSLAVEYGSKIVDELRANGVDMDSPESIQKAFADTELMDRIRTKAMRRGVPVAAFDAASAGVAGKILGPMLGQGTKQVALATAKEAGVQMLTGAAGEAAGSIIAGDDPSPKAMFEEAVGELVPGAREVIQNVRAESAFQSQVALLEEAGLLRSAEAMRETQGASTEAPSVESSEVQTAESSAATTEESQLQQEPEQAAPMANVHVIDESGVMVEQSRPASQELLREYSLSSGYLKQLLDCLNKNV